MIRVAFPWAFLALTALTGCGRLAPPEMRVCMRVSDDGACIERREDLSVGKTYTLVVRGRALPDQATLELVRFEEGRAVVISTAPLRMAGRRYVTNPVTLPRKGWYRLALRVHGRRVASTNVRAPHAAVWNVRTTTPAETPPP